MENKKLYLTQEEFIVVKKQVKKLWRKMSMLHLRMANDIDTKNSKPINKEEIKLKLLNTKEEIDYLLEHFL